MIKRLLGFLKSKTFFKHLFLYILLVVFILWLVSLYLNSSTKHGETVKVPDFKNIKINELDQFVVDKKVNYMIIDSIYAEKSARGVVIRQEPEAETDVKEGRKIYLYVTSILPPKIQMPKLVDRSLRQAASMIESYGLKLNKKIEFKKDQCANCVLEQLIKGKKIEPGQLVAKGTVITLVVGKGMEEEDVGVPCLYGLTKKEALEKLIESSMTISLIKYDVDKDSMNSRVYKQIPACGKDVTRPIGSSMEIYLTTNKLKIPDGPPPPEENMNEDNLDNEK